MSEPHGAALHISVACTTGVVGLWWRQLEDVAIASVLTGIEELLSQLQSISVSSFVEAWSACTAKAQAEGLSRRPRNWQQQHQQQHEQQPALQQHEQQPDLQQPCLQDELPSQLLQQGVVPDV